MLTRPLRLGSMFSGYGGLELGIFQVLAAEVVFHVEIEPAPARILARHWPAVPNLGDVSQVNWSKAPRVDVLCGGFPCQDVSPAGLRKGLRPGTRSGLWSHFALAIAELRPSLVIVENVRGLLSAAAHSELEPDAWALGDGQDGPALRAVGAVLGDLADLGYDARWCCVPASTAGAPHQRERVFIVAHPQRDELARKRSEQPWRPALTGSGEELAADTTHVIVDWAGRTRRWGAEPADRSSTPADAGLDGREERTQLLGDALSGQQASHRNNADGRLAPDSGRVGRGADVIEVLTGQPDTAGRAAPDASDNDSGRGTRARAASGRAWGVYGPAIARWEEILGRQAPDATEDGRLSPRFVEWMMGLPAGHVTEVGLRRSQQLKALGNGVVPQQAALALRFLLGVA